MRRGRPTRKCGMTTLFAPPPASEAVGELRPRSNVELCVDPGQVGLDRADRDVQLRRRLPCWSAHGRRSDATWASVGVRPSWRTRPPTRARNPPPSPSTTALRVRRTRRPRHRAFRAPPADASPDAGYRRERATLGRARTAGPDPRSGPRHPRPRAVRRRDPPLAPRTSPRQRAAVAESVGRWSRSATVLELVGQRRRFGRPPSEDERSRSRRR